MKNKPFFYFGYGLLADENLVEELLGRRLREWEGKTTIRGFQLKVLEREELPEKVKVTTDEGFKVYGLVEDPTRRGEVRGLMLDLSSEERTAVDALNFGRSLYKPFTLKNGVKVRVDILRDPDKGTFVKDGYGLNYNPFLNGLKESIATTRAIHHRFIRPLQEGNHQARRKERL